MIMSGNLKQKIMRPSIWLRLVSMIVLAAPQKMGFVRRVGLKKIGNFFGGFVSNRERKRCAHFCKWVSCGYPEERKGLLCRIEIQHCGWLYWALPA